MKKILSLIKYVLLAICAVTLVIVMTRGENGVDLMLNWAYILLGIAIAASVLFPMFNLAQNPKGAMRTLLGLGLVVIIVGVSYAMSSVEPVANPAGGFFDKPSELKLTDTGLYTTYAALAGAIVLAVLGEIRNSFK